MTEFYRRYKKDIDRFLVYGAFIAFVYFFVTFAFHYVAPFVIGFLLSVILEPLVKLGNQRLKIPRGIMGFFCIILVIFLVAGLGSSIYGRIVKEATAFVASVPYYISEVNISLENIKSNYTHVLELIPESLQESVESIGPSVRDSVLGFVKSTVAILSTSFVKTVPAVLLNTLLTLISMFFFIKDRQTIANFFLQKSPPSLIRNFNTVKKGLISALFGYIRAQLILMSISATICITGLVLIKFQFALFVGLIIACVDALPIFGSGFVLWPWALFSAIMGDYGQAIGLMLIYATIIVTRQSLEPKVLGTQIGVYPLVTLMSMFIGLKVFGPLGLFIGPFIVITIKALNQSREV